jgi:hypothetical protein
MVISRSVVIRMRNVSDKSCGENQNTHFVFNSFFFSRKSCRLWDNVENLVEPYMPQMTVWRMSIECWITKATNIIGICNTCCSSTATMVTRTPLNVTLYVRYLSCCYLMWNIKKYNKFGLHCLKECDVRVSTVRYTVNSGVMLFAWKLLLVTLISPDDGFLYISRNMLRIKVI